MRVVRPVRAAAAAIAAVVAFGAAGSAGAVQLTLVGDERLNQFGSGLPGTDYQTGPGGVDYDQIGSVDPHPGIAVISGTIPSLNFNVLGAPSSFDFTPDLEFQLFAELVNATIDPLGGSAVRVTLEFSGAGGLGPDLIVIDPSDSTTVLEADLVSGILDLGAPAPVAALTVQFTILDVLNPPENPVAQSFAFFEVRPSLYASLFEDGLGGFDVALGTGTVTNFDTGDLDPQFDFDDIFNAFNALPNPGGIEQLISSESEANGQVFSLSESQFSVPEPALSLLLLGTAGALSVRRRGGARRS